MDILYEQCRRGGQKLATPSAGCSAKRPTAESLDDGQEPQGMGRRSFLVDKSNQLRDKLWDAYTHSGGKRGWLTEFVRSQYPFYDVGSDLFRTEYRRCNTLIQVVKQLKAKERKVSEVGATCSSYKSASVCVPSPVPPGKRRRRGRPGRRPLCEELREELFAWFVDTIENVQGRINSRIMLMQAEIIASGSAKHRT